MRFSFAFCVVCVLCFVCNFAFDFMVNMFVQLWLHLGVCIFVVLLDGLTYFVCQRMCCFLFGFNGLYCLWFQLGFYFAVFVLLTFLCVWIGLVVLIYVWCFVCVSACLEIYVVLECVLWVLCFDCDFIVISCFAVL